MTNVQQTDNNPPEVHHDSHDLSPEDIHALLGHVEPPLSNCTRQDPSMDILCKLVGLKYQLIVAYISYGDQLRAFFRDGVHGHFQTHIEEERAQVYELNKKITALGGDAPVEVPPIPPVCLTDASSIFHTLQQLEEQSVQSWQALFDVTTHDAALNGMAQNGAVQDQQHADDMKRYLRSCPDAG
jgi:hypothetical protein